MTVTSSRSTPKPLLRYFILYGFSGGKAHSRTFRRLMAEHGMQPATNVLDADIIIAHSAGSLMVPKSSKAKLTLLIGVPLNRHTFKTYVRAHITNFKNFFQSRQFLQAIRINVDSTFYLLVNPLLNFRRARIVGKHIVPLPDGRHGQVVWIMNQHDPWSKIPELERYINDMPYSFVSLRGSHDTIWTDPAMFVGIISQYANRLLAQTRKR